MTEQRAQLTRTRQQVAMVTWNFTQQYNAITQQMMLMGPDSATMQQDINAMLDAVSALPGCVGCGEPVLYPGGNGTMCLITYTQVVPETTPLQPFASAQKAKEPAKAKEPVSIERKRNIRPVSGDTDPVA